MHGANYRQCRGQVYARKEYIKGKPQIKIAKFSGGKPGDFDFCVQLLINERMQLRHSAIESTRLAANKTLEKTVGETGYSSRLRIYPHALLRENKQIATAGADRISEGMRRSFGKATSLGAYSGYGITTRMGSTGRRGFIKALRTLKHVIYGRLYAIRLIICAILTFST